ncbi:hypothetical protein J2X72_004571 [Phyllobacterium sp. 1468]|uniref:hypothetical protein n=1 Tax=Phyllobacterium sp. 1468 TaxID=2817759 RepID=UPI00285842B6|nr:hypothetical protein [Phyllobacterium sp. 1468]MDR6635757.1 hypothetical protein [Phyllobacterium sp. 1468]
MTDIAFRQQRLRCCCMATTEESFQLLDWLMTTNGCNLEQSLCIGQQGLFSWVGEHDRRY